ncbi:MAG: LPS export ABC transporter periplasmic protein LptC [Bacteroidia bacterium]|nr:LPS export ABC transporter periplasmic protein LptC [Bacteroidia bacterium]
MTFGSKSVNLIKAMPWRLLTACLLLLSACKNRMDEVNKIARRSDEPSEIARNITITHTDSGKVTMKLESPVIYTYPGFNARKVLPKGVHVSFLGPDGKPETEMTSGYAVNYEGKGKMEARINVVVVNNKGETLKTEHLIWEEQTKRIYTNEFVTITTKDEILYGDGLESNQEFTKYRIKNIKGTIAVKE